MHRWLKSGLVIALLLGTAFYALAEDITLTTYYPSPRGVYQELRTSGDMVVGSISGAPGARLHVIQDDPASAVPVFRADDEANDTTPFLVDANGNVGIGTTTPSEKLELTGALKLTPIAGAHPGPSMYASTTGGGLTDFIGSPNGFVFNNQSDTANLVRITNDGNVGIGTNTPQALLDVNGGIRLGNQTICDASTEGSVRYNFGVHNLEFCNGTTFVSFIPTHVVTGSFVATGAPSTLIVTNCQPTYVYMNRAIPSAPYPGWERWDWGNANQVSIRVGSSLYDANILTFEPNGFTVGNVHPAAGETWWYWAICQ